MDENNEVQVTSVEEYQNQMQEGLNHFLEHTDGNFVRNNKTDGDKRSLTLTGVFEGEEQSKVVETDVTELSFEDCRGEFEFVVIDNSHFRFTIHSEPCWEGNVTVIQMAVVISCYE